MAVINDLIERISDPELRRRISEEVARMQKRKKFGLVFEEHLPEATPLYDLPIKKKSLVSLKDRYFKDFYLVKDINGEKLICEKQDDSREKVELNRNDVVAVAQFGQPIYPYLKIKLLRDISYIGNHECSIGLNIRNLEVSIEVGHAAHRRTLHNHTCADDGVTHIIDHISRHLSLRHCHR